MGRRRGWLDRIGARICEFACFTEEVRGSERFFVGASSISRRRIGFGKEISCLAGSILDAMQSNAGGRGVRVVPELLGREGVCQRLVEIQVTFLAALAGTGGVIVLWWQWN